MRITTSDEFLNALALFIEKDKTTKARQIEANAVNSDSTFRLGTIDPNYVSGRPKIIFSGETVISEKQYPYLSSYTPRANDIVLLAKISNSYVILGKKI